MIRNKLMLFIAAISLAVSFILNFPYPHKFTLGESILQFLNIPIVFMNGFHAVGVATLILLIAGLYLLVKSLNKFKGRIAFISLLIVVFAPALIVSSYQKTFATDIYTINYSNDPVQFTIDFNEKPGFEDYRMVSLMNINAPYEVSIGANESKQVQIEANINVIHMDNPFQYGYASHVNVTIMSNDKSRRL